MSTSLEKNTCIFKIFYTVYKSYYFTLYTVTIFLKCPKNKDLMMQFFVSCLLVEALFVLFQDLGVHWPITQLCPLFLSVVPPSVPAQLSFCLLPEHKQQKKILKGYCHELLFKTPRTQRHMEIYKYVVQFC